MNSAALPCGWQGSVGEFLDTSIGDWLDALREHYARCMLMRSDEPQEAAWRQSFAHMQAELGQLAQQRKDAADWLLVFEYQIPRERGRRPDAVLLAGQHLLVLEFKGDSSPLPAYRDQVDAYARDLANYHADSHDKQVTPVLVLEGPTAGEPAESSGVWVIGPSQIGRLVSRIIPPASSAGNPSWVLADYEPLPSLVDAARRIFRHEPLPRVRRAISSGIPKTVESLIDIAEQAASEESHHLALVTGVPGSGKTLVGLQFVYNDHFGDTGSQRTAVFLSGNGPLVQVLQHALRNRVFVQDIHGFLKEYGGPQSRLPSENIWVYDEAQRAWDAERVFEKRGHRTSEPEDFVRIGERKPWAMLLGLIGEGQEIHLGEEAGLGQWNDAIKSSQRDWVVHCPEKLVSTLSAGSQVVTSSHLDLTVSLRSHLAEDVQAWIKLLLEGDLATARTSAARIATQGFALYITRDLEVAKDYVIRRYAGAEDFRYGLLASSKAKNAPHYGADNSWQATRRLKVGPWFNDPPASTLSCCQLDLVATEFACQGLELDMPIITWGDDLIWNGGWRSKSSRSQARDPHALRINSYRVLLSRGRDGVVVFVPPERVMDPTYQVLVDAGMRVLRGVVSLKTA